MNTGHMEIRNQIRLKTFRPEIHFNSHVHIFFLFFCFHRVALVIVSLGFLFWAKSQQGQ